MFGKLDNEFSFAWIRLGEELGIDSRDLAREVNDWKAKLPENLRDESFGELLYNPVAYHTFLLPFRLAKFKGVETKEMQQGFESFFQREVKLRLDQ